MSPSTVILYSTTFAATLKIRSDITKIKHILDSKKIPYADVDLSQEPHRRVDMLKYSDNNHTLPQLHVNNRFIGSADEIQELEDWGELEAILRGESPGKVAAESAAAAQAEALASSASLALEIPTTARPAVAQPSFSPSSSPPAPEIDEEKVGEEVEVATEIDEEEEQISIPTASEDREESFEEGLGFRVLEPEPEDQQEDSLEQGEDIPDTLDPPALDLEIFEDSYKGLEATKVDDVENLEQQQQEEEEEVEDPSFLFSPTAPTETSCYFSPILVKTTSQEGNKGNGNTSPPPSTIEPELVVVQATFQDLDITTTPNKQQQQQQQEHNEDSVSLNESSVTPSPFPFKQEIEEQGRELEHTLDVALLDKEQREYSPSPKRSVEAHPLGEAVHAHAVPVPVPSLEDPLDQTTEDEEYIVIDTSPISSPTILAAKEKRRTRR